MLHDAKSAIIPLGRDTESHRNILNRSKEQSNALARDWRWQEY
jgi:hypothetical protein